MPNAHQIITIDGPAGVGKSTIAKRVAEALGIAFLDTGAMFRSIALAFDKHEFTKSIQEYIKELDKLTFSIQGSGDETILLCNDLKVGDEIRTEKAGTLAAKVAIIPEVRNILKKIQQTIGATTSLVAEGRDMGTVIFPKATCKIFLDASPEIRGKRRFLQLQELGKPSQLEEIISQIQERDEQDRNRTIAPLKPAKDALIIDTSYKELETVFNEVMNAIHTKIKK